MLIVRDILCELPEVEEISDLYMRTDEDVEKIVH